VFTANQESDIYTYRAEWVNNDAGDALWYALGAGNINIQIPEAQPAIIQNVAVE
jgi:hypothetical protein